MCTAGVVRRLVIPSVAAVLLSAPACGASDSEQSTHEPEPSLEYKLAVLDRGGFVADDDPLIARFGRAMDGLEARCPETRERLADMAVKGRRSWLKSRSTRP